MGAKKERLQQGMSPPGSGKSKAEISSSCTNGNDLFLEPKVTPLLAGTLEVSRPGVSDS